VKTHLLRAARFLVLPTLLLGGVVAFAPGRVELAVRTYALLLAAVALAIALALLRRSYPRPRRRYRRRKGAAQPRSYPPALARIEQEVALGVDLSFDLHHRLRPRLRTIATDLLAVRRRLALDGDPERARRALGEPAWELVRPERPPPADRQARGIAIRELRSVVESLERL
jgi:hypothetical protein